METHLLLIPAFRALDLLLSKTATAHKHAKDKWRERESYRREEDEEWNPRSQLKSEYILRWDLNTADGIEKDGVPDRTGGSEEFVYSVYLRVVNEVVQV